MTMLLASARRWRPWRRVPQSSTTRRSRALFMSAGIVDHETGTRDIRRPRRPDGAHADLGHAGAGGFRLHGRCSPAQRLPVEGDDAGGSGPHDLCRPAAALPMLATLAAVFSVAYSRALRALGTFPRPRRHDYPHHPHDPPQGHWLPVAVLVLPVIAIGLFPRQGSRCAGAAGRRSVVAGRCRTITSPFGTSDAGPRHEPRRLRWRWPAHPRYRRARGRACRPAAS